MSLRNEVALCAHNIPSCSTLNLNFHDSPDRLLFQAVPCDLLPTGSSLLPRGFSLPGGAGAL